VKDRLQAHARRIANIRGLLDAVPETGAWSLMREANRELELAEAEARALGEAASTEAGGDL
jgi:hypothetical protein